ncbi:MAG: hypothetical protein IKP66_06110, partial [Lachnospiraceae bacterium]|nr:hypothetical protein [Lachnospiraceae bacterium]
NKIIEFPNKKEIEQEQKKLRIKEKRQHKLIYLIYVICNILMLIYTETLLDIAKEILKNLLLLPIW